MNHCRTPQNQPLELVAVQIAARLKSPQIAEDKDFIRRYKALYRTLMIYKYRLLPWPLLRRVSYAKWRADGERGRGGGHPGGVALARSANGTSVGNFRGRFLAMMYF